MLKALADNAVTQPDNSVDLIHQYYREYIAKAPSTQAHKSHPSHKLPPPTESPNPYIL